MNKISKQLLKIAREVNQIYNFNKHYLPDSNEQRYENKTERNFKSQNAVEGFISYILEDRNIIDRITGIIDIDNKTSAIQTQSAEYDQNCYIILKPNYGQSTLNIKLKNDKITNKFITNKTVRNWNDAKEFIIYLIDNLETLNIKTAKTKLKKATYGLMFDNPDATKREGDFPILKIKVTDSDIIQSACYDQLYKFCENLVEQIKKSRMSAFANLSNEEKEQLKDYFQSIYQMVGIDEEIQFYVIDYIKHLIDGLKKLAKKGTTYMSGNFKDWSEYYNMQPMKNAQDVINAADASLSALGTFGLKYKFSEFIYNRIDVMLKQDLNSDENSLDKNLKQEIRKRYPYLV